MTSSSQRTIYEEHDALSSIEPVGKRRKVDESTRLFDVFINHRGPDVKHNLALDIYNSLAELGIRAFHDSEEKKLGDSFPSTIEGAILSASAHVAIFSKGYAESPWCLAELVLMFHSGAKIFPVFYEVKPSDLRHIENGGYANAFAKYEEKNRYKMEKLNEWKQALQSSSFIAGYEISRDYHFSDCKNLVSAVQKEVQRTASLYVAKYPVGLQKLVNDFERQCLDKVVEDFERNCRMHEIGKERVQIVGILGMGGLGKTTLAKELFNRKRSQYTQACFLFEVREAYANKSFPSLQMKLVKDLYNQNNLNFHCTEEGTTHIGRCIKRSQPFSFLIVLDDVDQVQQLDALLIMDMLKKTEQNVLKTARRLIIVTTRDVGVLINAGITTAYNLKRMERGDARELFCWHAFGQPHPAKDYENMVNSFLNVGGGLPLSLKVIGSHVRGRDENYWRLELNKVNRALPRDVHQRLKISFDALDYDEQQIFIDIACFFVGKLKSIAVGVWEASGCSAQYALETLKDKCLVQEESLWTWVGERGSVLRMHDCLRDLGREMAKELSHPRRLWCSQALAHLETKGFQNILAETKSRCFHSFIDKSMNCRITFFLGGSDLRDDDRSTFLLWLQLEYYGYRNHPYFPSWIPLQKLRSLKICNLWVKALWQSDVQVHSQSTELQIHDSFLGDFSGLSGMLGTLENNISDLDKLMELNISLCQDLKELGVGHFRCLEKLILNNCYSLKTVSGISNLKNLVELDISKCPLIEQMHLVGLSSLKHFKVDDSLKWTYFELGDCSNIQTVSGIQNLGKVVSINIRDCAELQVLPSLQGLRSLRTVTIEGCGKLKSIFLSQCQNLERVMVKFGLTSLEEIAIHDCGKVTCFQLFKCQNLKQVFISDCGGLEVLPCFACQNCLEKINIIRCGKLQNITLPKKLVELRIEHCRELKTVRASCSEHLMWPKRRTNERCEEPRTIQRIDELHGLKTMQISYCSNPPIRDCISMLKSLPLEFLVVSGRALLGDLSTLNPRLFSDIDVLIEESTSLSESPASHTAMVVVSAQASNTNQYPSIMTPHPDWDPYVFNTILDLNDTHLDFCLKMDTLQLDTDLDAYLGLQMDTYLGLKKDPLPLDTDLGLNTDKYYSVLRGAQMVAILISCPFMMCSDRKQRIRRILKARGTRFEEGWTVDLHKDDEWKKVLLQIIDR